MTECSLEKGFVIGGEDGTVVTSRPADRTPPLSSQETDVIGSGIVNAAL